MIQLLIRFALLIVFIATAGTAAAQGNAIADCEPVQNPDTQFQMDLCSSHIGCALVIRAYKACARVKSFLGRLQGVLGGRSALSSNDVFDAAAPALTPDPILKSYTDSASQVARESERQPDFRKTLNSNGNYVELSNIGAVTIFTDGYMRRGQLTSAIRTAILHELHPTPDGYTVVAGPMIGGKGEGLIALQTDTGRVRVGLARDSVTTGIARSTDPDGSTFLVAYDDAGKVLKAGPRADPGQRAALPTGFESWEGKVTALDSAVAARLGQAPGGPVSATAAMRPTIPSPVATQVQPTGGARVPATQAPGALTSPAAARGPVNGAAVRQQCAPQASVLRNALLEDCRRPMEGPNAQDAQCVTYNRSLSDSQMLLSWTNMVLPIKNESLDESLTESRRSDTRTQLRNGVGSASAEYRLREQTLECGLRAISGSGAGPASAIAPSASGTQRSLSAAAQQFAGTSSGDVCRGEPLNNNQFEAAMQRIAGGGPTVQIRAALVGIDLQILAYRKCAGSASALSAIEGLERQYATALQTCKKIAANDNCLVAPF